MSSTYDHRVRSNGQDTRGQERPEDETLAELLSDLSDGVTRLFRQEVELAKLEVKREATAAGKAAAMLAAGAVAGFVALLLLAWALSWALALVMPTWAAFLIVGLLFGAVAAGLLMTGRKKLQAVDPTPHQTIETLQEDREWLSERTTS